MCIAGYCLHFWPFVLPSSLTFYNKQTPVGSFSRGEAFVFIIMFHPFQHYLEMAAEYPDVDDSNYEIIEG